MQGSHQGQRRVSEDRLPGKWEALWAGVSQRMLRQGGLPPTPSAWSPAHLSAGKRPHLPQEETRRQLSERLREGRREAGPQEGPGRLGQAVRCSGGPARAWPLPTAASARRVPTHWITQEPFVLLSQVSNLCFQIKACAQQLVPHSFCPDRSRGWAAWTLSWKWQRRPGLLRHSRLGLASPGRGSGLGCSWLCWASQCRDTAVSSAGRPRAGGELPTLRGSGLLL